MKKTLLVFVMLTVTAIQTFAQNTLPSVSLKKLDGSTFNSDSIQNNGKPIIICLWATWCQPCIEEFDAIAEEYPDWQKQTGVKLIAVSVDNPKTMSKVKTTVDSRDWGFEYYTDASEDFKHAIGATYCPYTIVLNAQRQIVWKSSSSSPGSEEELFEIVKKVAAGESVSDK